MSTTHSVFLINKWLDPIFSLGVGIWAYKLYEREHPRPAGHTLQELLARRYNIPMGNESQATSSNT